MTRVKLSRDFKDHSESRKQTEVKIKVPPLPAGKEFNVDVLAVGQGGQATRADRAFPPGKYGKASVTLEAKTIRFEEGEFLLRTGMSAGVTYEFCVIAGGELRSGEQEIKGKANLRCGPQTSLIEGRRKSAQ